MLKTILPSSLAISASMIGSVTLIAPITFIKNGIIFNIIILIIFCSIYALTCSLWAHHAKFYQDDVTQVAGRLLGIKARKILSTSSGLTLCLLISVYFILFNQTFYRLLIFLFKKQGWNGWYAQNTENIVLDKFSIQYLCIISGLLLLPISLSKNIQKIIKASQIGIFFLIIVFLAQFIIALFNIFQSKIQWQKVLLFPDNFNSVIDTMGIFSLAFICHPTVLASLKTLQIKKYSSSSVALGYFITMLIYIGYGLFGSLSIYPQNHNHKYQNSILDFYQNSYMTLLFGINFCLYLICLIGIFPYVSKQQLIPLCLSEQERTKRKVDTVISVIQVLFAVLMQFFNVKIGIAMGFTGAVMAILVCFIYPVYIHLKCLRKNIDLQQSYSQEQVWTQQLINKQQFQCPNHKNMGKSKLILIFYSFVILFSILNMGLQIYKAV